jgi:hypothetical protein
MLTDLSKHADAIIEAADADISAHEARKAAGEPAWDGAPLLPPACGRLMRVAVHMRRPQRPQAARRCDGAQPGQSLGSPSAAPPSLLPHPPVRHQAQKEGGAP